ncbi:hypothetical protein IWW50_005239, partial [Coemansia erecta]
MPTSLLKRSLYVALEDYPILVGRLRQVQSGKYQVVVDSSNLNLPLFDEVQCDMDFAEFEAAKFNPTLLPDGAIMPSPFFTGGFDEGEIKLADIRVLKFKDNSGVAISISVAHSLMDGYGFNMFVHRWAEISQMLATDSAAAIEQLRQSVKATLATEQRISDNDILMASTIVAYAQGVIKHEAKHMDVRKSLTGVTSEYISQTVHGDAEADDAFRPHIYKAHVSERLMATNFTRFNLYTTNFGWGIPQSVVPLNYKFPKFVSFFPAHPSEGGYYINIVAPEGVLREMQTNELWSA